MTSQSILQKLLPGDDQSTQLVLIVDTEEPLYPVADALAVAHILLTFLEDIIQQHNIDEADIFPLNGLSHSHEWGNASIHVLNHPAQPPELVASFISSFSSEEFGDTK